MNTETQVYVFTMIAVGTVMAVLVTLLIAKVLGLAKTGDPLTRRNEAVQRFGKSLPGFSDLSQSDQQRIAKRAIRHPVVIAYAMVILAGFIWLALGYPPLLDAINAHWRYAAIIGIALLAVILFGVQGLQTLIAKRLIAQARANRTT